MNSTSWSIARACFFGTIIGCITMLALMPQLWFIGALTGFAGGYLAFRFKEVGQAIVRAAKETLPKAAINGYETGKKIALFAISVPSQLMQKWHRFGQWAREKDRPFETFYALMVIGWSAYCFAKFSSLDSPPHTAGWSVARMLLSVTFGLILGFTLSFLIGLIAIGSASLLGINLRADKEGGEFEDEFGGSFVKIPGCLALGLLYVSTVLPIKLAIGTFKFFARFTYRVFVYIHSRERLLCGIDSAIGGTVFHFYLRKPDATILQTAILLVAGGIIGAAWGVFNYEIISRRLLHLVPPTRAAS